MSNIQITINNSTDFTNPQNFVDIINQLENINSIDAPKIGTISQYAELYKEVTEFNALRKKQIDKLNLDIQKIETYADNLRDFTSVINQLSENITINNTPNVDLESIRNAINDINIFYKSVNDLNLKIDNFKKIKDDNNIDVLIDNVNKLKKKMTDINVNIEKINSSSNTLEFSDKKSNNNQSNGSINLPSNNTSSNNTCSNNIVDNSNNINNTNDNDSKKRKRKRILKKITSFFKFLKEKLKKYLNKYSFLFVILTNILKKIKFKILKKLNLKQN